MIEDLVLRTEVAGVITLTLNRPDSANALSGLLLQALQDHLAELRFNPDARVVVLTGAGEKVFCAGADLKERKGMDERQVRSAVALIQSTIQAVADLPQPVIAAINGGAFGGGTELALAADLRVAASTAQLGLTETSLAIIPGAGGTQRLTRLVGIARAKELIYTARRIDAATALVYGLVNEVTKPGQALQRSLELAQEISCNGPIAVRQAKFAIDRGSDVDLQTGLRIEAAAYERVLPTDDRIEGLIAFAEKRKPRYKGK